MEKRRQIEAMNGEFQLPEPIIHRVQSFLTAKEAGRTAILSKSWCSAWSTRPNIVLDSYDLMRDGDDARFCEFKEFAEKTFQRYEQSNLKIQSFKIKTFRLDYDNSEKGDLVNDLILRALKIGATHLKIKDDEVLPQEVFESENLVGLSLDACKIDDLASDRKVRCMKLESLRLKGVRIQSTMLSNIASCCPLIEKLSLCNLRRDDCNYDDYDFDYDYDYDYQFLSDLSSKFPSLKDLTLRGAINAEKVRKVSSRTLERLNFSPYNQQGLSVEFDVPSIRKFIFEGRDTIPLFSFVSVSTREWESYVSFKHCGVSTSWFCSLNKFLRVLSLSKVHLSLYFNNCSDYAVGDIGALTKPKVENLMISVSGLNELSCYAVFDGLFRICRPKFITLKLSSKPSFRGEKSNDDFLCKRLVRGLIEKRMYELQDLEEVNVQLFDEDVHAWCPLTLESLSEDFAITTVEIRDCLHALVPPKGKLEIRFQLKWMENAKHSCKLLKSYG